MNYSLVALVLDSNPELPLTEAEFLLFKQSRSCLTAAFSLEEIYNLLLTNYRELEMEALGAAVDEMTSWKSEYSDHFAIRASINRRTLNLLSATRLYLDQFQQWLKEIGADPEPAKRKANEIYEALFEYRFMEALRNHVQHVGLAVHGVASHSRWVPQPNPRHLEYCVAPYTLRAPLAADPQFKKRVLNECPERVDTLPAARGYVGGISEIHEQARILAEPFISVARTNVEAAIARHGAAANQKYMGLAAISQEDGSIVEQVPVFLQWDDVRQKLVSKNRSITNLSRRALSTLGPNDA